MRHYIFVGIAGGIDDDTLAALRERDAEDRNRHGLVSVLGSNMRGALPLGDDGLAWLSDLAEKEKNGETNLTPPMPFDIGDTLRINVGKLRNFSGTVCLVDLKAEEVVVEISLIGTSTQQRYAFDDVLLVEEAVNKAA